MIFNKLKTLLFFILITSFAAPAQVELTLEKCREMALDYSKQIKISENRNQQAVISKKIARAQYLPNLNASGIFFYKPDALEYSLEGGYLPTYSPDDQGQMQPNVKINPNTGQPVTGTDGNPVFQMYAMMPDMDIRIGLEGVTFGGLQIEQPVYMGGKIRAANRMAKTGIEMAEEQLQLKTSEVLVETDAAWYQYLAVEAKLKAAEDYQTLLDSLVSSVSDSKAEGMATRNDLLKVQVKRNEAILMRQKASSGLKLAGMNLCRMIGLPLETEISIAEKQGDKLPDLSDEKSNDITNRPEYQLLDKSIALKQQEEEIARAGMLPQVGLSAGYNYLGGVELNGQSTNEMAFSAMASVKIPIFKWFEEKNKVSRARLQTEIARTELEETQILLQMDIARARLNLEDAYTRLALTQTALDQANENLETSQTLYDEGMEPLVDLLEAQAQWQKTKSEYIDAQTSVKLMHTKYLKAIGKLSANKH